MSDYVNRAGLQVADILAGFVESRALPGTGIDQAAFWAGFAKLLAELTPVNKALLAKRDDLQARIDAWHLARAGQGHDAAAYETFLHQIGYLVAEPAPFKIGTTGVDEEIAKMAGPQLVVPSLNDRFVLNAANARWGSLYDALYGTDVLDASAALPGGYDAVRGAAVIAYARAFLDVIIPGWEGTLSGGEHVDLVGRGEKGVLFRHHDLHIEIVVDRTHPIGAGDPLGIADVML